MLNVFKWPKGYAVGIGTKLVQFSLFGLYGTEDEETIEYLNSDERVKFLGEGDEFMVIKPEAETAPDNQEDIRELRDTYKEKFGKKANANWKIDTLKEKLADEEETE